MPKSRSRKKGDFTPPPQQTPKNAAVSARWVAPVMVAMFLIGLVWVVMYYISGGSLPIAALGAWNLVIGFAFIFVGLMVSTRWK